MKIAPSFVGRTITAAAACCLSLSLPAQSVTFNDFAGATGLVNNGSTAINGSVLRLVSGGGGQIGSSFLGSALPVESGFDTTFEVQVSPSSGNLPEGFAFVVQVDPAGASALGGPQWGLGYAAGSDGALGPAIENSIAIEFDFRRQSIISDQVDREISIHTQGALANDENESASIGRVSSTVDIADGQPHMIRIAYDPGTIEVYVDDLQNPQLTTPYDFATGGFLLLGPSVGGVNLANSTAFVGFTAASGPEGSAQQIDVRSWSFEGGGGVPCFAGTVGVAGGGMPETLMTINSSTGDFFGRVQSQSFDPLEIRIDTPSAVSGSAAFLLFISDGAADGSAAVASPWGEFCFDGLLPTSATPLMAPATIQVPAGLGILGEFTLQGLISEDASVPSALAVTNALVLELVPQQPPVIDSIAPAAAVAGDTVTLSGSGFSSATVVELDGVAISPTSVSSTMLELVLPPSSGCDATFTVTNIDGQTSNAAFNPSPSITSVVNPNGSAGGGTLLVVIGTGFGTSGTATVTFDGNTVAPNTQSDTVFTLSTPPGTSGAQVDVEIQTAGGCVATTTFTYN